MDLFVVFNHIAFQVSLEITFETKKPFRHYFSLLGIIFVHRFSIFLLWDCIFFRMWINSTFETFLANTIVVVVSFLRFVILESKVWSLLFKIAMLFSFVFDFQFFWILFRFNAHQFLPATC